MAKVVVVTDSIAYIPKKMMDGLPIYILPQRLIWNGRVYLDGVDISSEEFYRRLQVESDHPGTSQATPMDFIEIYRPLLEKGYDIFSVHVSSRVSGTFHSGELARRLLGTDRIELFDSLSGSMAQGWQALGAARAALQGATLRECRMLVEKIRAHSNIYFIPATLDFLHRGGRIGGAAAFLGSLLQVKPILAPVNGVIEAIDKIRTFKRALDRLVGLVEERVANQNPVHLVGLHANVPDLAFELLERARERLGRERVVEAFVSGISPALGTHIGPGAVGLGFMAGV
jgi:DegV family protein with EDD domain